MNSIEDLNLSKKYKIKETERNLYFLPPVFRCIVNGTSGSGKTNLLINLLYKIMENEESIRFQICSKTIEQPLYRCFIDDVEANYNNHSVVVSNEISYFNEEYFSTVSPEKKEIIIIDDMLGMMSKKDTKILIHLFSASRPRGISIFFLTQRYTKLEVVCRRNSNYLITFKPSLEEANKMCQELLTDMIDMFTLISEFKDKPFYALFFDLDKNRKYDVFEIFNLVKTEIFSGFDEMVEELMLLIGEFKAGNDSEKNIKRARDVVYSLENHGVIEKTIKK